MKQTYYPDIFYHIQFLPFPTIIDILRDAKDICFDYRIDKLNCHESLARQSCDTMNFDEILCLSEQASYKHFVFVYRRGYLEWKNNQEFHETTWQLEIGLRTKNDNEDYFLFIYVDESKLSYFLDKYKELKEL